MIGERWKTTRQNNRILTERFIERLETGKVETVCSCGAPGGSAHNHMTGEVAITRVCSRCALTRHNECQAIRNRCACADRGHRAG